MQCTHEGCTRDYGHDGPHQNNTPPDPFVDTAPADLFFQTLADIGGRVVRCAEHGTPIVDQRCATCDQRTLS